MQIGVFWSDGWHPIHVEECDSADDGRRWMERRGDLGLPIKRYMTMVMCEADGTAMGGRILQLARVPDESRQDTIAFLSDLQDGIVAYRIVRRRRVYVAVDDVEFGLPTCAEWSAMGLETVRLGDHKSWCKSYLTNGRPFTLAEAWYSIFGHSRYIRLMLSLVRSVMSDHLDLQEVRDMLSGVDDWLCSRITHANLKSLIEKWPKGSVAEDDGFRAYTVARELAIACVSQKQHRDPAYALSDYARRLQSPVDLALAMHSHVPVAMAAFGRLERMVTG